MGPRTRLAVLVAGVAALFVVFGPLQLVPIAGVRDAIDGAGILAPIAYVVVSGTLGAMLVPGPLLAGIAGVLFGSALGAAATVAAATLSATIALVLSRRVGREGAEQIASPRVLALSGWLERHGLGAVIIVRLAPSVPDAPVTYAMGLTRIRLGSVVLGTAIGVTPRAFAYATLGSQLDDLGSPLALVAFAVLVLSGVVGAALLARHGLRTRRRGRIPVDAEPVKGQRGRADD